jgi:hypothetical protein
MPIAISALAIRTSPILAAIRVETLGVLLLPLLHARFGGRGILGISVCMRSVVAQLAVVSEAVTHVARAVELRKWLGLSADPAALHLCSMN